MSISLGGKLFNLLAPLLPNPMLDPGFMTNPTRSDKANHIPGYIARSFQCESRTLDGYALHTLNVAPNIDKHIVFFHGGAYVAQTTPYHWFFLRKLAKTLGVTVSFVQYPLAPEHVHTETIDHAVKATEFICREFSDDQFYLMGDSAGGGLSLALVRNILDRHLHQPYRKIALISPKVDPTRLDNVSSELREKDLVLDPDLLIVASKHYAGNDDLSHPNVSPMLGSFADFPAIGVWMGTRDIFYGDMPAFFEKLEKDGVRSRYYVGEGMLHDYPLFPIPEGRQAIEQMKAFICD